ncbi:hypothetical protein AMECASPLE_009657 [Ameca splendens]|uniref:Uncharacterized protein n=1 Tax=Ameca splendens TaxID=208324 RepID=A0ABV1A7M6_9TELE
MLSSKRPSSCKVTDRIWGGERGRRAANGPTGRDLNPNPQYPGRGLQPPHIGHSPNVKILPCSSSPEQ